MKQLLLTGRVLPTAPEETVSTVVGRDAQDGGLSHRQFREEGPRGRGGADVERVAVLAPALVVRVDRDLGRVRVVACMGKNEMMRVRI